MKAEELRIGNYISDIHASKTFYEAVKKISDDRVFYGNFHSHPKDLKPIPITEEWLLKFGFEYVNHTFRKHKFCVNLKENELYILTETHRVYIEYVHQLQNLYFALTNQEL